MATSFVTSNGSDSGTGTGASVSNNVTTGGAVGDTAYFILNIGASAAAVTVTSGPGSGWTLDVGPTSGGFTSSQLIVWRKVLTSSDVTSLDMSFTLSAARQYCYAFIILSGGTHQGYSSVTTNSADTTPSFGAVTPSADDALIVAVETGAGSANDVTSTRTPPSGYTERADLQSARAGANRVGLGLHTRQLSGGNGTPTTPGDETVTVSSASYNSNTVTICYKPTSSSFSRTTSDTAMGTDATARVVGTARSLSDAAGGSDTVARMVSTPRPLSETAMGTDTVARATSRARTLTDTAAATDTAARTTSHPRATSDTAVATDTVTESAGHTRTLSDSAAATDTVARLVSLPRTTSDTAAASDTVDAVLTNGTTSYARSTTDSVSVSDTVARTLHLVRALTDAAAATATTARLVALHLTTTDSVGIADTVLAVLHTGTGALAWWDGTTIQTALLLGWWDGTTVQPATLLGWWDGATVQPVAS